MDHFTKSRRFQTRLRPPGTRPGMQRGRVTRITEALAA
jgi:hypothetical protein